MSSFHVTKLGFIRVQLQLNSETRALGKKTEQHLMITHTLKGAIAAGEREQVELAKSFEQHRSDVIEALRRVNKKVDFKEALGDLIRRLREISEIVSSVDGITMRNMLPLDVPAFLDALHEMNEVWQKYDDAQIFVASQYQELNEVSEKLLEVDRNLRSLVVQHLIVTGLRKNNSDSSSTKLFAEQRSTSLCG